MAIARNKVIVDTDSYVSAHRHTPRGYGSWWFRINYSGECFDSERDLAQAIEKVAKEKLNVYGMSKLSVEEGDGYVNIRISSDYFKNARLMVRMLIAPLAENDWEFEAIVLS